MLLSESSPTSLSSDPWLALVSFPFFDLFSGVYSPLVFLPAFYLLIKYDIPVFHPCQEPCVCSIPGCLGMLGCSWCEKVASSEKMSRCPFPSPCHGAINRTPCVPASLGSNPSLHSLHLCCASAHCSPIYWPLEFPPSHSVCPSLVTLLAWWW